MIIHWQYVWFYSLDCPTVPTTEKRPKKSSTSNLQLIIIIICVILLIVIVLLVVLFLLYRRRALCFGKVKQRQQKAEKNVHVELQNIDSPQESKYDRIDDNVGNPLYASVGGNNDDTQPMLSPVKKKPDEFISPNGRSLGLG